jgi:hypothetical protein
MITEPWRAVAPVMVYEVSEEVILELKSMVNLFADVAVSVILDCNTGAVLLVLLFELDAGVGSDFFEQEIIEIKIYCKAMITNRIKSCGFFVSYN